jgi:hypothetical protein
LAVTSLADRSCAERPNLAGAHVLSFDSEKRVTVDVGGAAECWQENDARSVYPVFKLPEAPDPYLVTVTSAPVGEALFSPRLAILDSDGNTLRTVRRDQFVFHGSALYVGLRAHPGERYLVVASDPATIGAGVSQLTGTVNTTMMTTGAPGAFFNVHTGSESTGRYTYAHNGSLTVTAEPMPKAD